MRLSPSSLLLLLLLLPLSNSFTLNLHPPALKLPSTRLKSSPTDGGSAPPPYVDARTLSSSTSSEACVFPIEEIAATLPHRYPFALLDRVVSYEAGRRAVGVKCVTQNEPHFTGHFPDRPIMPGVLQVEALAQLAGVVCLNMEGAEPGSVFFFAAVDGVKWKRPVTPGDKVYMEVEITNWKARFGIAKAKGRAYVDGEEVVSVESMTFALAK